jgi:hypothetical protein
MTSSARGVLMALALAAAAPAAGCAHHPIAAAPDAAAAAADRERYYEQHAPKTPVPKASLFFASPLVLRDGERAEPGDLLPAVAADSATAAAVARYEAASWAFWGFFGAGAVLEATSTASTIVGAPLLAAGPDKRDTGLAILIGGRVVEVVGFAVIAAGYFLFKGPIVDARDVAFGSYDADLRARLALPVTDAGGTATGP